MSLRQRVVLTLAVITAILVVPAVYAVVSLRELRGIADQLHSRDADALLALGELQRASAEADRLAQVYVVFYEDPRGPGVRAQNDSALRQVDAALAQLRTHPAYRRETSEASRQWRLIEQLIATERDMLARTDTGQQRVFRDTAIVPAVARMDSLLTPIADAITRTGTVAVDQAKSVAGTASNTTWLALACALALTVLIGSWLTRGAAAADRGAAAGDGARGRGRLRAQRARAGGAADELGDLARSFTTMTEQLAELDRLKAEFVSVASHEIKTPLSVIRGYVSLLIDGIYGAVNEQQKKTLESVSDQVDRLTRLVHRLLDISRFEAGGGRLELRRINVRDFLDELTGGFHVLAFQNGIDFSVNVAGDAPVNVEGDADRLNEVLGNILSNAFKFTRHGGRSRWTRGATGRGWRWRCATAAWGSRRTSCPRSSRSSTRWTTTPSRARWDRGWGWPSPRRSWRPMGARSLQRAKPAKAQSSG
jgi:signal transduction histidine kinase